MMGSPSPPRFLLLLVLLAARLGVLVHSQAMIYPPCEDGPCVETINFSCSQYESQFDFSGDCCSLSDDNDGNCTLTVSTGSCVVDGRTYGCVMPNPGDPTVVECVSGPQIIYSTSAMEECPASTFDVLGRNRSMTANLVDLSITLTGKSSFTSDSEVFEWEAITAYHTVQYIQSDLDMPYYDLITYVTTNWDPNNSVTANSVADNTLTIHYLQQISWRPQPDDVMVNGAFSFVALAFNEISGSGAYLLRLQAIDAFASITDVSVVSMPVIPVADVNGPPIITTTANGTIAPSTALINPSDGEIAEDEEAEPVSYSGSDTALLAGRSHVSGMLTTTLALATVFGFVITMVAFD